MSNEFKNKSIIVKQQGQKPGPTLVVMAGVHGNEKIGVEALKEATKTISVKSGVVYYVIANPAALERGQRFVDMDLNRAFKNSKSLTARENKSYERWLAKKLMPYLNKTDALLDLHSVPTAPATPFVICEKSGLDIARKLPFPVRSSGWGEIHPGSTDGYMNDRGKIGLCVECGQYDDPQVLDRSLQSIKMFLALMGVIKGKEKICDFADQRAVIVDYTYRCENYFSLVREIPDFTPVRRGEMIGVDAKKKVKAPYDGVIVLVKETEKSGEEAFVMGRLKSNGVAEEIAGAS